MVQSIVSQVVRCIQDPIVVTVGAASSAIALITAGAYGIYRRFAEKPPVVSLQAQRIEEVDQELKALFKELSITDYYLITPDENSTAGAKETLKAKPIFDKETTQLIEAVKEMFKQCIEHSQSLPNLILTGEPGVGKTMLSEELCRQSGIGFIRVPSGVMESLIKTGNHIEMFRRLVNLVEKRALVVPSQMSLVYYFTDDGEMLVAKRDEGKAQQKSEDVIEEAEAPWLKEQERLSKALDMRRDAFVNAILEVSSQENRHLSFCITTNRPQVIDPAFITRCKVLHIKRPTEEERKKIIITHLPVIFNNNADILSFFNKGRLESMAQQMEGFTGREIVSMLANLAVCVRLEKGNISQDLLDATLIEMKKQLVSRKYEAKEKTPSVKEAQAVMQSSTAKAVDDLVNGDVSQLLASAPAA